MLLACSAMAMAAGCGLPPRAQKQLNDGYEKYKGGDNAGTVAEMNAFIQENPRAKQIDEAHYLRGLARYNLKQYDAAKSDLLQAITETENNELRGKASLAQGDLSYETGDMTLAENMYRHALETLPETSELRAQAYYRLGCVLQRLGEWRAADQQFHKAIDRYRGAEPARRSARMINANAWTVQAGSFTKMNSAQAGAKKLASKGLPAAHAAAVLVDGNTSFVVQVGRYDRYEDAQAMLAKIRQVQSDAFIAPTR
jgi:tetratricopeptide (TPR) repeat protein